MRRRLAAAIDALEQNWELSEFVTRKLGVDVPWAGQRPSFRLFLRDCAVRDVLDLITLVFHFFIARHMGPTAAA